MVVMFPFPLLSDSYLSLLDFGGDDGSIRGAVVVVPWVQKVWRNERHLRRGNIGRENRYKTIKEQERTRKSGIKVSTRRRRGREGYNSCSLPFVT